LIGLIASLFTYSSVAQSSHKLKSTKHGLRMMFGDISKEEIIDEMRFEDGPDREIDVIRFDHVGPNLFPLIISSKMPVATDSLGILAIKLNKDTLHNFLEMIDLVNPKSRSRKMDKVLVRVTYRYNDSLAQYYVTDALITTKFLKAIEKKLISNSDPKALETFHEFIGPMRLRKVVNRRFVWVY
jgi:hypothetical protein